MVAEISHTHVFKLKHPEGEQVPHLSALLMVDVGLTSEEKWIYFPASTTTNVNQSLNVTDTRKRASAAHLNFE